MPRSIKKGCYVCHSLLAKILKMKNNRDKTPITTYSRRSTITPDFLDMTFKVHNGRTFVPVYITEDMIGHKLGEFALTRKFTGHTQNK